MLDVRKLAIVAMNLPGLIGRLDVHHVCGCEGSSARVRMVEMVRLVRLKSAVKSVVCFMELAAGKGTRISFTES